MLGPNGSGKTTTIRMMTTLSPPTSGTARVAGYDIQRQPAEVRKAMGLTAQAAALGQTGVGAVADLAAAAQIARKAAQNPPLSNFAICSAISHMQNMSALDAAYAEAAVAGVVNTQAATSYTAVNTVATASNSPPR